VIAIKSHTLLAAAMNNPNIQKHFHDRPTNKLDAAATLLHLVIFGLVVVMIVVSFGLASSSWLLGVRRETLVSSRIGETGIEFLYPHSAVILYTEGHTAPPAAIADLPSSVKEMMAHPSAGQNLATSDVQSVGPGSSSNFEPPSDLEANPTIQETGDAPSTQAIPIDETLGASQESAPVPIPPLTQVVNASPTALAAPAPAVPIPDKDRDQLFEAFGTQHPQPAKFDEGAITTLQTPPAQPVQNKRANKHPLGSKAAFQYRVKKECGPIHDPQLRQDCVSSFSAYHR
jgi:hypothetical protein